MFEDLYICPVARNYYVIKSQQRQNYAVSSMILRVHTPIQNEASLSDSKN